MSCSSMGCSEEEGGKITLVEAVVGQSQQEGFCPIPPFLLLPPGDVTQQTAPPSKKML